MTSLNEVQAIVDPYGYTASSASPDLYHLFEADLDDGDKYELGRTHYRNWRKELACTFSEHGTTFCIKPQNDSGALAFGATPFVNGIARIWMLKTKSFGEHMVKVHGRALPHRLSSVTRRINSLFLQRHRTLFNFIPRSQTRTIRWLKQAGFVFFEHPNASSDILFFAQGDNVSVVGQNTALWSACIGEELSTTESKLNNQFPAV